MSKRAKLRIAIGILLLLLVVGVVIAMLPVKRAITARFVSYEGDWAVLEIRNNTRANVVYWNERVLNGQIVPPLQVDMCKILLLSTPPTQFEIKYFVYQNAVSDRIRWQLAGQGFMKMSSITVELPAR